MTAIIIKNISSKILIVGPIYNNVDKLLKIETLLSEYEYIIFNGNLINNFDIMDRLLQSKKVIYNMSDLDFLSVKDRSNKWYDNKPNIVIAEFLNQTKIIIVSGGITTNFSKTKLLDNLEISFVNNINDKPWHELYGGAFGYIISNNPLTYDKPKFYNYSAQIGNYQSSNQVYAQEADQFGLKETICL